MPFYTSKEKVITLHFSKEEHKSLNVVHNGSGRRLGFESSSQN